MRLAFHMLAQNIRLNNMLSLIINYEPCVGVEQANGIRVLVGVCTCA